MEYKTIRRVKTCPLLRFYKLSPPVNMSFNPPELTALSEESDDEMPLDLSCYRRVRRVSKISRGTQTDTDMVEEKENEGVKEEEEDCCETMVTPPPSPPRTPSTPSLLSEPSDPSSWTESQVNEWLRSIG